MSIRDEINRKIIAYENAMESLGKHETVARELLLFMRREMLEVLELVDREPMRRKAA